MIKTSLNTLIDSLLFYTVLVDFVLRNRVDVRFFSSPELKNNLKLDEILSCFESVTLELLAQIKFFNFRGWNSEWEHPWILLRWIHHQCCWSGGDNGSHLHLGASGIRGDTPQEEKQKQETQTLKTPRGTRF